MGARSGTTRAEVVEEVEEEELGQDGEVWGDGEEEVEEEMVGGDGAGGGKKSRGKTRRWRRR